MSYRSPAGGSSSCTDSDGSRVICLCAGTTVGQVRAYRDGNPLADLEESSRALGCARQCGSCAPTVAELLGQQAWFDARLSTRPLTRPDILQGVEQPIHEVCLEIDDPAYPIASAGQHIVLRVPTPAGQVERTYTIVRQQRVEGTPHRTRVLLGVKRRPEGQLTPWMLSPDREALQSIEISAPGGPGLQGEAGRPVVFFAGGIGITPAMSLLYSLPDSTPAFLDHSTHSARDRVYEDELARLQRIRGNLEIRHRATSEQGRLNGQDVRSLAGQFPDARFFVCGPESYVELVRQSLLAAGVRPQDIRIELFRLQATSPAKKTFRFKAYLAATLVASASLFSLVPALGELRPHGAHMTGHETLECTTCHAESTASVRQVLQANARYWLGKRETGAEFGHQPITNATCLQCHGNPDDLHAPNRFLELRFDKPREALGVHQCISCHREHEGARITVPTMGYCVHCHQDTEIENDPATPTHAELIAAGRWTTCLQCHDYHGNHKWRAPSRLTDALPVQDLLLYFRDAPPPYGETVFKALKEPRR
jgi:ferredoxin-NADP reductase/bacterioferritin-associated ferredoxin